MRDDAGRHCEIKTWDSILGYIPYEYFALADFFLSYASRLLSFPEKKETFVVRERQLHPSETISPWYYC